MAETISSFLIAAKRGDIRTANALLLEKPSVINETLSLTGANALYISCQNNHENILKLLLSKKNWNMQSTVNDGTTPLYIAAKSGHIRIAKILIERCSADINYSCQRNTFITPLHVACLSRKIEMVKYLIHSGCNIDKPKIDGKTPLITSVLLESVSLVKILLENGANKNIKDLSNTSALEYAKKLNNKTLVSLLSDVKKTTSSSGLSAGNIYDSKNLAVDIQNVSGVYYKNGNFLNKVILNLKFVAEIAVEKDTIATTDGSGCLRNNKSTVNKTIIPSATNKKPLVSGRVTSPTKSGLPNNRKLPNSNHPNSSKDILLSKNKPISETKKTSNLKATPAIKPFPIKRLPQKIFPLEKLNCTQQIIKKTNNQNLIFQKEIGKGGFGIVFKGLYKNKVCAIKKINLKLDNENKLEVLKNFLKEAQVMQSMKHENIVKFIDFDLESFSIIMEYMELGSLVK
ncbi:hypothetical protein HK099_001516 [Clydaea vesicula]|uniref:Protein kinase domain-containing protein n=1 Tax=Clydaea vesicula TaxID=447962 RepID=A0AAD5XZN4_9FUNG|nr:hypothetical protein HK099_001516 [Clydaea vesicula]